MTMIHHDAPTIDMTSTGEFRDPPRRSPSLATIALRVAAFGLMLGFAAIAFWLAVFTVPVLIVIGLAFYLYARFQLARTGRSPGHATVRVWRF